MKRLLILVFAGSIATAKGQWPAVTQTSKPWTRWWWMGSAVDEKNISSSLAQYQKAGFGGVEIVPIYGAMGYEQKYIPYLSPAWVKMLDHTVQQSTALNMGVYISVGTGWPIGGPQVTPQDAATKLVVQQYSLNANETLKDKIVIADAKQKDVAKLSALMAYSNDGKVLDITGKLQADGVLNWKPETGNWQLYAAFIGKTRQAVKRAAPGGEGFTLDHFSKTSVGNYLKKFDAALNNTSHGVKAFYNDSYEVYGANFTADFFDEFYKRRGYDLKLHLNELVDSTTDNIARLKSDYRETMADLMRENFSETFTKWSHNKNVLSLNQAHGSPGNLLDLYAAVDIPEAETFGSSYFPIPGLRRDSADVRNVDPDPNMLKFASSAAHAMGNKLVSCETFTWLTEHFKTSWSQCKPELEQVFLSGINHMFYHGTTYSPAETKWPGWLFYASMNVVPNNSLWPQLNGLNDYITRCQSVLQSGQPDNEILAYWPVYDAWNKAKGMDMPMKVHDIDEWLHPTALYKNLTQLQAKGYSVDLVSDRMLSNTTVNNGLLKVSTKGAEHKVLLVSQCKLMPVVTFSNIIRLAKSGAIVVLQDLPADVPGLNNLEGKRKELKNLVASLSLTDKGNGIREAITGKGRIIVSQDVQKGFEYAKINRETLADTGLKFIRRKVADGKYYYIVNHTQKEISGFLPLQVTANAVTIMNPLTGAAGSGSFTKKQNTTDVRLQLKPGEALIVKNSVNKSTGTAWRYATPAGKSIELNNEWTLHFKEGGPQLPSDKKMATLKPWTMFTEDSTTQSFSGTGVYSTSFELPAKKAADYLLQLSKVYESAKVFINDKEAGILWCIPFETRIGKYLQPGKNTIRIEVANLMANRIRNMDRNGEEWRRYHEINFVNINYKNFDAANWKVQPSGLEGPVTITALQ